jgi:hypothetical protein
VLLGKFFARHESLAPTFIINIHRFSGENNELLAPELGEEENQEGVDLQPAEEHAGGEDPFGSSGKMGEVVHRAHLARSDDDDAQIPASGRGDGKRPRNDLRRIDNKPGLSLKGKWTG